MYPVKPGNFPFSQLEGAILEALCEDWIETAVMALGFRRVIEMATVIQEQIEEEIKLANYSTYPWIGESPRMEQEDKSCKQ